MARTKKRRKLGGRPRKKRSVSLKEMPYGGDHGTGTSAAMAQMEYEPILNDSGHNPNHMARLRRKVVYKSMKLELHQHQAAETISDAYEKVQTLSSGSELKEQVDASPRPDATIAKQVDIMSHWAAVTKAIRPIDRDIIEHVLFKNLPLKLFTKHSRQSERFKQALDFAAASLKIT